MGRENDADAEVPWLSNCLAHVIDDDTEARTSTSVLLRSMGLATEAHASAEAFLGSWTEAPGRGALILDLRLLGMSGIDLLERLSPRQKALFPVVMVSAYADVPDAVKALELGAYTLLTKPYRDQELWDAVVGAAKLGYENELLRKTHEQVTERLKLISKDERDVMERIITGASNKEISKALDISLRTVDMRKKSILTKLDVENVPELIWTIARHNTVAEQLRD